MKELLKWSGLLILAAAAALLLLFALQPPPESTGDLLTDLSYPASADAVVIPQQVNGTFWLFLPAHADFSRLTLWFQGGAISVSAGNGSLTAESGKPFDLASLFPDPPQNGQYALTLSRDGVTVGLTVMKSAHVGSLYLTSPSAEQDRAWVDQSKDNRTKGGSAVLLRADGGRVFGGGLKTIKSRGHSSWYYPKKPYQFKLNQNIDLLETGDPSEAASTWVLLANYNDETLIHNSLTYDLAAALNLPYSPHGQTVDLYYDGIYRGTYFLCEKTEIGAGRVELNDLEQQIETANPGVEDFRTLELQIAETPDGRRYQYADGLTMPEDISGGYLLEMELEGRLSEEACWFRTSNGGNLICKSPEYLSAGAMEYISGLYQNFEDAVYNGGTHPVTGLDYSAYMDVSSLARCYLLLELSQDGDAFCTSTYFYKPQDQEKLYAGPIWDFDYTYGLFGSEDNGRILSDPEGLTAALNSRMTIKLLSIPSFQAEVQRVYRDELYPLLTGTVLNPDAAQTGRLRALAAYGAECAASQAMNRVLWTEYLSGSYSHAVERFQTFLTQRNEWLYAEIMSWTGEPLPDDRFVDVPQDRWYSAAVDFVTQEGLFTGVSETRFNPHGAMTRAMAVTVLHRLAGLPEPAGASTFSDVRAGLWYSGAVAWAEELGIVTGGRFEPDRSITREELVTMLYRWDRAMNGETEPPSPIPEQFTDRGAVRDWAVDAFGWAIRRDIIQGTTPSTLSPEQNVQRCEAAAILQRFAQNQVF